MTGREFIDKIELIEEYIANMNTRISTPSSSYTVEMRTEDVEQIRIWLNDYRRMLLEGELK